MINKELKKQIYDLSFNDKNKLMFYLLELIKEDYDDLKNEGYEG